MDSHGLEWSTCENELRSINRQNETSACNLLKLWKASSENALTLFELNSTQEAMVEKWKGRWIQQMSQVFKAREELHSKCFKVIWIHYTCQEGKEWKGMIERDKEQPLFPVLAFVQKYHPPYGWKYCGTVHKSLKEEWKEEAHCESSRDLNSLRFENNPDGRP